MAKSNTPADDVDLMPGFATCEHGIYKGLVGGYCDRCDEYEEKRGGIDKCLNCGRYQWGDKLNKDQICAKPCRNPNEY